jgi:hypothetical protein
MLINFCKIRYFYKEWKNEFIEMNIIKETNKIKEKIEKNDKNFILKIKNQKAIKELLKIKKEEKKFIKKIILTNIKLDNLKILKELTNLETLVIINCYIENDDNDNIKNLKKLNRLVIKNDNDYLDDLDLELMGGKEIKSEMDIDIKTFGNFEHFKNLQNLYLGCTSNITSETINNLPNLESLKIFNNNDINTKTLNPPKLKYLKLNTFSLSESKEINLSRRENFGAIQLSEMPKISNLVKLNISSTVEPICNEIFPKIDIPNLKSLNIRGFRTLKQSFINKLKNLKNLEKLTIYDGREIQTNNEYIFEIFPKLKYLNLNKFDIDKQIFEKESNIEYLKINKSKIKNLEIFKYLTNLKTLKLEYCQIYGNIHEYSKYLKKLLYLNFFDCDFYGDNPNIILNNLSLTNYTNEKSSIKKHNELLEIEQKRWHTQLLNFSFGKI